MPFICSFSRLLRSHQTQGIGIVSSDDVEADRFIQFSCGIVVVVGGDNGGFGTSRLQTFKPFPHHSLTNFLSAKRRTSANWFKFAAPVDGVQPADTVGGKGAFRCHCRDIQFWCVTRNGSHAPVCFERNPGGMVDLPVDRDTFLKLTLVRNMPNLPASR